MIRSSSRIYLKVHSRDLGWRIGMLDHQPLDRGGDLLIDKLLTDDLVSFQQLCRFRPTIFVGDRPRGMAGDDVVDLFLDRRCPNGFLPGVPQFVHDVRYSALLPETREPL